MVTTDRPVAALPVHKQLVEGKLDNGFSYVILPNQVPAGRFEAHLEVLSGSAHELDQQQGKRSLLIAGRTEKYIILCVHLILNII